ncbi:MAG TPA: response regulator [Chloroflexi bacterium]|nr:response regulator [Chloroflexota bacterium]
MDGPGCQILIISDFPLWEVMVRNMLDRGGCPDDEVYFATGDQGLLIARHHPPDLVIAYLWTLHLDGYEVCRQLPALPVLLQGAISPALVYPQARQAGAAGYLRQPVTVEELVAARRAVLCGAPHYPPGPSRPMQWETPIQDEERGRRILVIDTDPEQGDLIQMILGRGRDDQVQYAHGGRRGVAAASADPPDLVIVNLMMGGMSGLEVYQRLAAAPTLARIPVLFQTAWEQERSYSKARECGARGCLTLPCDPQELVAARDALLRGETYYP